MPLLSQALRSNRRGRLRPYGKLELGKWFRQRVTESGEKEEKWLGEGDDEMGLVWLSFPLKTTIQNTFPGTLGEGQETARYNGTWGLLKALLLLKGIS